MSNPSITVTLDRIVAVTAVSTTACDTWRAAVRLSGELDAANAADVRAELMDHFESGRRLLRVDTSAVTFIDTTVLGVLVEVHTRCVAEHGTLIVTGVRSPLDRLLTMTGLNAVLLVDSADQDTAAED